MKKDIIKDIEKMLLLQDEIIEEYNRLRQAKTDSITGNGRFTPTDNAQLTLLEHLVGIIIG